MTLPTTPSPTLAMNRRALLRGSAATLVATGVPGLRVAFADTPANDILVVVFLRGAADTLSLVAPVNDPDYIANRPTLALQSGGTNAAIPIGGGPQSLDWRLHPKAQLLANLYGAGQLAVVHATGLLSANRSHFTSQDMMERGYADGESTQATGWIGRYIAANGTGSTGPIPTVSLSSNIQTELLGDTSALSIPYPTSFSVRGGTVNQNTIDAVTKAGTSLYQTVAQKTITGIKSVSAALPRDAKGNLIAYSPSGAISYGSSSIATSLTTLAQLIKAGVGITMATVDFGGWDTHQRQANTFDTQVTQLSSAIAGFWSDMAAYQNRVTLVTMTEFGRRFKENASNGTDHGHGSAMFVLGANVNGGQILGKWPGLSSSQLDLGYDLAITTDYRQVLAEMLTKRKSAASTSAVFPTLNYSPVGVFK